MTPPSEGSSREAGASPGLTRHSVVVSAKPSLRAGALAPGSEGSKLVSTSATTGALESLAMTSAVFSVLA
jgi:hypothetical protein